MTDDDEIIQVSAAAETNKPADKKLKPQTPFDYIAISLTTFGVGFMPLVPGTFGSLVGVAIYLFARQIETGAGIYFLHKGFNVGQITAWIAAVNAIVFIAFCLLGVWASNRATILFQDEDPQKVVVDEVVGQLLVFMFVPFEISWKLVLAGFLLFRLFDIWKPYPIRSLEKLHGGLGICADDLLAGVYGGIVLSLIYALSLSF